MRSILVILLSIIFLSGCMTTMGKGSSTQIQELQAKVSALESEVARNNETIRGLENKLAMRPAMGTSSTSNSIAEDIIVPTSEQIQTALKNAGYYIDAIDGKIGAKTKEAIMAFQTDHGLKVDGKVGAMTWSKLKEYSE